MFEHVFPQKKPLFRFCACFSSFCSLPSYLSVLEKHWKENSPWNGAPCHSVAQSAKAAKFRWYLLKSESVLHDGTKLLLVNKTNKQTTCWVFFLHGCAKGIMHLFMVDLYSDICSHIQLSSFCIVILLREREKLFATWSDLRNREGSLLSCFC